MVYGSSVEIARRMEAGARELGSNKLFLAAGGGVLLLTAGTRFYRHLARQREQYLRYLEEDHR